MLSIKLLPLKISYKPVRSKSIWKLKILIFLTASRWIILTVKRKNCIKKLSAVSSNQNKSRKKHLNHNSPKHLNIKKQNHNKISKYLHNNGVNSYPNTANQKRLFNQKISYQNLHSVTEQDLHHKRSKKSTKIHMLLSKILWNNISIYSVYVMGMGLMDIMLHNLFGKYCLKISSIISLKISFYTNKIRLLYKAV